MSNGTQRQMGQCQMGHSVKWDTVSSDASAMISHTNILRTNPQVNGSACNENRTFQSQNT